MCVCVCACVCVCVHACVHACVCNCVSFCVYYVYICHCIHVSPWACLCFRPKMASTLDDFEVVSTIGTGSYGTCKKIRRKKDNKVVLVFVIYFRINVSNIWLANQLCNMYVQLAACCLSFLCCKTFCTGHDTQTV